MKPEIKKTTDFMGGGIAIIRKDKCTECGSCIQLCRFEAISEAFVVDPLSCEGCGVCVDLCPDQAIDFPSRKCGEWFISDTRFGPMVHARLGIAEENSGKLVSLIRQQTSSLAEQQQKDLIITDGPPGIGCPVIASITGATALVIVVEPSVSGVHDLKRVAELATHFRIPAMVCINKYDINQEIVGEIESFAKKQSLRVIGSIPFDTVFTKAMVAGQNIFEYGQNPLLLQTVEQIWSKIINSEYLNKEKAVQSLPVFNP